MTSSWLSRVPVVGGRVDRRPVVAVVRLHGVITPAGSPIGRGVINLAACESMLTRAFGQERLVAVALAINSPGGSATQSAMVAERIRGLAGKANQRLAGRDQVPVLAFCEDVAASGGYWLACAADEIYAHATSLVGSIGVVSAGFGMAGLLERFGVERRVHTAGTRKVRLDPFRPESPEDVAWLAGLQGELHEQFVVWVRERRGATLAGEPGDLFSGEVFTGAKAVELGLVDGLGTLRGVLAERFPGAQIMTVEPRRNVLARLGITARVGGPPAAAPLGGSLLGGSLLGGSSLGGLLGRSPGDQVLAVMDALEQRAAWSRFGL